MFHSIKYYEVYDIENRKVYLDEGDYGGGSINRVGMEVDLRSEDKRKRFFYFFINGNFHDMLYIGIQDCVKFAVYFFL